MVNYQQKRIKMKVEYSVCYALITLRKSTEFVNNYNS
jgi:hypothetical protein